MKLTDLAPLDRWIELEEDIHRRAGSDINVFGYVKACYAHFTNEEYVRAVDVCGFLLGNGEGGSFLVNKMTDTSEDKVERSPDGITAIATEKAEILVQYFANQIAKIVVK